MTNLLVEGGVAGAHAGEGGVDDVMGSDEGSGGGGARGGQGHLPEGRVDLGARPLGGDGGGEKAGETATSVVRRTNASMQARLPRAGAREGRPAGRAALARTRAGQTGLHGGIGTSDYTRRRFPCFLASAVASQRACAKVYPALGEMSLTPPSTATAAALVAAHDVVNSALTGVRTRHAALDKQIRHWVRRIPSIMRFWLGFRAHK